jgi:hypothetical protein
MLLGHHTASEDQVNHFNYVTVMRNSDDKGRQNMFKAEQNTVPLQTVSVPSLRCNMDCAANYAKYEMSLFSIILRWKPGIMRMQIMLYC